MDTLSPDVMVSKIKSYLLKQELLSVPSVTSNECGHTNFDFFSFLASFQ